MQSDKIRVAVVFGGKSGEHEVSLASARSVMAAMDKEKYEVFPIGITKSGRWLTAGDPLALLTDGDNGAQAATAAEEQPSAAERALTPSGERELIPGAQAGRFPAVDVVFPVLHGTYGEDGSVQGLLELADLPYVGAGILGSTLGMDKTAMKYVLQANDLPVVDYYAL
ncbi:MAG: D-alanine--D-alanine ligase A, partial [Chloroflexi bacterium]|nr:D-alanine--D-alanine ligase A [Chloroflexota bacterium]